MAPKATTGTVPSPVGVVEGPGASRPVCPSCGGRLSEPVSGDVHCYVSCRDCGEQFELDDPRLAAVR